MKKEKLLQEITELKETIEQNESDIKDYLEMYEVKCEEVKTIKADSYALQLKIQELHKQINAMRNEEELYTQNKVFRKVRETIDITQSVTLGDMNKLKKEFKQGVEHFSLMLESLHKDIISVTDDIIMPIAIENGGGQWMHQGRMKSYKERHIEKTA
jgi:chromosome segregation ATPase